MNAPFYIFWASSLFGAALSSYALYKSLQLPRTKFTALLGLALIGTFSGGFYFFVWLACTLTGPSHNHLGACASVWFLSGLLPSLINYLTAPSNKT